MDWNYKFEIEENEDLQVESKIDNVTSGVIFLIECNHILFDKTVYTENNEEKSMSWFQAIMKSCLSIIKNKAITTDKDNVSIVFYRVKSDTDVNMKNVYVLQALEQPNINDIQKLMELPEVTKEKFDETFGFSDNSSLYNGIWCCQGLFAKCKTKLGSKQILLFTYDDDPYQNDANFKRMLLVKVRDLKQSDIHLEIIPVGDNNSFDAEKFYKMMIAPDMSDDVDDMVFISNPISKLEELMIRTRHKQHKKRTTARLNWFLGNENLSISVSVYNFVRKTPALSYVPLDSRSNLEVVTKRVKVLKENGQLLMPFDMKHCLKIDGKSICFEKDEHCKLRSILEPGMRLIGFKPLKYLKSYYQIRPSQFLYPDESSIEGSTRLFAAILKRCSERELFALCVYVPRQSSQLQFVALVPQMEKFNDSNVQVRPPGFSVIFLPFANDIRKLDLPLCDDVNEKDLAMSKELINCLSVEHDPETIFNPALQKKLAHIEAIALDLEKPDDTDDNTNLDNEAINDHCGSVLEKYKEHFDLNFETAKPTSVKSKIPVDLETYYKSGTLDKLTIPQLKDESQTLKIKIKGTKKADIIQCISRHYDSLK